MPCISDLLAPAAAAWPAIWVMDLLRYLVAVGGVLAVLAYAPSTWLHPRKVRIRGAGEGQRTREFRRSMRTVLIFSVVGTSVLVGFHLGWSRLYFSADAWGWSWLALSLPVLVVLHDAWFYWTHRLLHHRHVFRWTHRTHHESVAPTPWTAYSFSSTEAFVQAVFLPLVLMVIPVHQAILFLWMAWMVARNVMGHGGTELLPRTWLAGWWGRWCTTTLHHEMHHAYGHFNYGLYFVWWDRWCGTEHPDYRRRLTELVGRMDAASLDRPGGEGASEVVR